MIQQVRAQVRKQLLLYQPLGRRPWLQVIIDLTTLEKCGAFQSLRESNSCTPG